MRVVEIFDPKLLMKRPSKAVLMKSHGVNKPLFKTQLNRAKTFKHFVADQS